MVGPVVDEQRGHGQVEVAFEVLLDAADPSDVQIAAAAEPGLETPDPDGADDNLAEAPARSGRSTPPPRHAGTATPTASTDGVRAYLAEITRIPLLDAAEEAALAQRVQDGLAARALLHTASEPGNASRRRSWRGCATWPMKVSWRPNAWWRPTCGWSCPSPGAT